jgi:hypothetical protein
MAKTKEMQFIDVTDATGRRSCLGISQTMPHYLRIIGVLPHCSEITFDVDNAQKLIDFLQTEIIDK